MEEREERRERDVREERKSRRSNTNSQRKRIINKESQNVIITVHIIKYLVLSKRKKERYNLQNGGEFHLIGWLDLKISRF